MLTYHTEQYRTSIDYPNNILGAKTRFGIIIKKFNFMIFVVLVDTPDLHVISLFIPLSRQSKN